MKQVNSDSFLVFIERYKTLIIFLFVVLLHVFILLYFKVVIPSGQSTKTEDTSIFKLVDIEEVLPPPPQPKQSIKEEQIFVNKQAQSEAIIETEKEIVEVQEAVPSLESQLAQTTEIEYLPQHKISKIPEIPSKEILKRIQYPPLARKQNIEGVVYLELFIDKEGVIKKIEVLKDPGFGFAEAAIQALEGIHCGPAYANDKAVAVRYRYPVRFALKG